MHNTPMGPFYGADSVGRGPSSVTRFDRDVLAQTGVGFVILFEGINDIGFTTLGREPASADDIIQGHKNLIARAHAQCIKVIGATLTPFNGPTYYSPEGEAKRQAVNAFIRTSKDYDGFIDFDKAVRDPNDFTKTKPGISPDDLHFYDAGYQMLANSIDLRLFRDGIDFWKRNGNDKCRSN